MKMVMTLMTAGIQVIDGQEQAVNDGRAKWNQKMNLGPNKLFNSRKMYNTNIEMYREKTLRSSRRMPKHG
jgi:hypothetical protein